MTKILFDRLDVTHAHVDSYCLEISGVPGKLFQKWKPYRAVSISRMTPLLVINRGSVCSQAILLGEQDLTLIHKIDELHLYQETLH